MRRSRKNRDLWILAGIFVVMAVALHLGSALAGHSFYRDIHLGTALEYAKGSIALSSPVIVGFNANGVPTPQELPLWQAAAGFAMKLGGDWYGWANLVSLLVYFSCLWPVNQIARCVLRGERAAWWVTVCFSCQPLIVVHAGLASSDILCLSLTIWFLYFGLRGVTGGGWIWWGAAAMAGALAAISKLPFFMAAGLALFFFVASRHRREWPAWVGLGGVGFYAVVVFFMWTAYTDACLAAAEFPYIDLRVSENPYMAEWYFGTFGERLNPAIYLKSGWQFMNAVAGSVALVMLPVVGLCLRRAGFARLFLLAGVLTTMVFFNLVTIHRHYFSMFSLGMALAAGLGAYQLESIWRSRAGETGFPRLAAAGFVPLAGIVLMLSLVQGLIGMEVVSHFDGYGSRVARVITEYTGEEEKLLVCGGSWGGDELIRSGREGLSLRSGDVLEDPAALQRLRELGYDKLICLSESPLVHALQVTNPGGQGRVRRSWRAVLSDSAEDWPEVFSSEEILIVKLP